MTRHKAGKHSRSDDGDADTGPIDRLREPGDGSRVPTGAPLAGDGQRTSQALDAPKNAPRNAHSHAHSHAHSPASPASPRLRKLLITLLAPFAIAAVAGMALLYPFGAEIPTDAASPGTPVDGDVVAVTEGNCVPGENGGDVDVDTGAGTEPGPGDDRCLHVDVALTDGPAAGSTITKIEPLAPGTPRFAVGDPVVLEYFGAEPQQAESYRITDFQRGIPLLLLACAFGIAVLLLGRWQGLRALTGLGLSFVVIALFILPAILDGANPLLVGITGAGTIMFLTLYLSHGLSARTSVAVLGTLMSLSLIGVIAALFSVAGRLTGLDEPTSMLIGALGYEIDTRGLLLAGVVIGALGVLDDVTVTQSSAVWELRTANPDLSWRELYTAGLRIGRDHVAASVNTLVMAYAGAALPVLLYSAISGVGLGPILGSGDIAQEIVRTLAGSIGIVAAVPVTTLIASLIASREPIFQRAR